MKSLIQWARQITKPLLRISLGLVLVWIGALKFADPSPVVGLLDASLSFLAFDGFVYLLAVLEVGAGVVLFLGIGTAWVSLGLVGFFAATLLIFLIAPAVSYGEAGFPFLSLPGEFLLKDAVLLAASVALLSLTTEAGAREAAVPR
jgi:uncharacterized membrane protein YkgB